MFFSVKAPVKIAGKTFIPCVCYPISDLIKLNVAKLVSEGKAVQYSERVFFQNGKVVEAEPMVKTQKSKEKTAKKSAVDEKSEEAGEIDSF